MRKMEYHVISAALLLILLIPPPGHSTVYYRPKPNYNIAYPTLQVLADKSEYICIGEVKSKKTTDAWVRKTKKFAWSNHFWLINVRVKDEIKGNIFGRQISVRALKREIIESHFLPSSKLFNPDLHSYWPQDRPILFFINRLKIPPLFFKPFRLKKYYTYIGDTFGLIPLDTQRGKKVLTALKKRLELNRIAGFNNWGRRRIKLLLEEYLDVEPVIVENAYNEIFEWPGVEYFVNEDDLIHLRTEWRATQVGSKKWEMHLMILAHLKDKKIEKEIADLVNSHIGPVRFACLKALHLMGINRSAKEWVIDLYDPQFTIQDLNDRVEWAKKNSKRKQFEFALAFASKPPTLRIYRSVNMLFLKGTATIEDAPALVTIAESKHSKFRLSAMKSLIHLKYKPAIPIYRKLKNDTCFDEHSPSSGWLGLYAREALWQFLPLEDRNKKIMEFIQPLDETYWKLRLIQKYHIEEAAPLLIKNYNFQSGYSEKGEIIKALHGNRHPEVRPFFWRVIYSKAEIYLRVFAMQGIAQDVRVEDYDRLIELLKTDDQRIHDSIVEALGNLGDRRALPYIRAVFPDQEEKYEVHYMVRGNRTKWLISYAVVSALLKMNDPEAIPIYKGILEEGDRFLKEKAIKGLVQLGTPQARELLLQYARHVRLDSEWEIMKDFLLK